jgi:hypothetical protein
MERTTTVIGRWDMPQARALFTMLTATPMPGNGKTTNASVTAFTLTRREQLMKATGRTIHNGAWELKSGPRVENTLASTKMAKSKVMAHIPGLTAQFTRETGATIGSTELVSTSGRMAVNTMVTGTTTTCMGWAFTSIPMESLTRANTRKIEKKGLVFTSGQTAANTKVGGTMGSNMVLEFTRILASRR